MKLSLPYFRLKPLAVLLLFTSIGLCISPKASANDFYWSGSNSASWSDILNWVDVNGTPLNAAPSSLDDVYILDVSPYYTGATNVDISSSANCNSLFISVSNSFTISGSNPTTPKLSIYGSYTGDSDCTWDNFQGQLYFKSVSGNQTITMNGSSLHEDVFFESPGGQWSLQDDFISPNTSMDLISGSLNMGNSGYTVTLKRFYSDNINTRSLDISNTIINLMDGYDNNSVRGWDLERTSGLTWPATLTGSEIHFYGDKPKVGHANSLASEGLQYNKVHFHNTQTIAHIYGDNIHFDELILDGSTIIKGDNNVVDDFQIAAGKTYTLTENYTLSVTNSWTGVGSCKAYTTLTSSLSGTGKEATIDYTGNVANLNLDYLIIESVPLASATYNAPNIINMTNSSGWSATTATGTTYYWVNGAGDWSDYTHWSLTSGSFNNLSQCIPGPLDNVIFDAGSGLASGLACNVDLVDIYCHDMDWSAVPTGAEFTATSSSIFVKNRLNIYGSFTLSPAMSYQYDGIISCRYNNGLPAYINGIDVAGHTILTYMYMEGQNGNWQLQSDFYAGATFYVWAGTFGTNNYDMYLNRFDSKVRNNRTIDLTTSTVELTSLWSVHQRTIPASYDATLNLIEGTSTIKMLNTNFAQILDWGETYYNVELREPNITSTVYGSNQFNDLSFYGNGTLHSTNTINGVLLFTEGKTYTLSNVQTFGVNGSLDAVGNCNAYIGIKNGSFHKATGPISAEWAIIDNNQVSGTYNNTASNCIFIGNTSGWSSSANNTDPYHFKATTSENWGDPNNWYKTYINNAFSDPLYCIPSPFNDVFFHDNSFSGTYPNLIINELNAYCHSMTWTSGTYTTSPTVTSTSTSNRLNIFASLLFQPPSSMNWQFDGPIDFKAQDVIAETINLNGQVLLRDVTFDGSQTAHWDLTANFEMALTQTGTSDPPELNITQGKFYSNGHTIKVGKFYSNSGAMRLIDLTNSYINLITSSTSVVAWLSSSSGSGDPLSLVMTGSELHINSANPINPVGITATKANFNSVYFDNTGLGTIYGGDNTFQRAEFTGDGNIRNNNEFHVLRFADSQTYTLEAGGTQKIIPNSSGTPGTLDATGTSGSGFINIASATPGTQALLEQVTGSICIDYVNISDIAVSQPGTGNLASAGANSINIANNTGWAFDDCIPQVISGCTNNSLYFNTLVNGISFDWFFGDGQTGTGTPIYHTYTSPGTYNAYVVIGTFDTNGTYLENGRNFTIEIAPSCCKASEDSSYITKSDTITSYENWPDKVFISADVFVTGTTELDITNSDVVFAAGTGIYFLDQSGLSATNSTFRPCAISDSWSGLHFDDDSDGNITESIIINASNGVTASTNGTVENTNNQFLNNQVAIALEVENTIAVDHTITGNTITVNKNNPFSDGVNAVDFHGLMANGIFLESTLSQNEFVYASSTATIDRVYGIHNNGGSLTASDNTFTNVTFAYTQLSGNGTSSFENNTVSYNSEALNLYSNVADLVAVTIDGAVTPILIASNELNLSYDVTNNSRGIYINNATTVVIHENEIDGFGEGVHIIDMQGLISHNEVSHAKRGMMVIDAVNLGIQDNEIFSSTEFGIYLENSLSNIRVERNTLKNDADISGSIGIKYFIDQATQPNNVEFIENCVFDTEVALEFSNLSSDGCMIIPFIRGNYLFSYASYGLYVHSFYGSVGTGGSDPGRNSFLSNNVALASDIYYQGSGQSCDALNLVDNWPAILSTSGPGMSLVNVQVPGGAKHSQSTCGNQDIPEFNKRFVPVMQSFLLKTLPIEEVGDEFTLTNNFLSAINAIDESEQLNRMELILALLIYNDEPGELNALLQYGEEVLTINEASWLRAKAKQKEGQFNEAATLLSGIGELPYRSSDFIIIEKMRLDYLLNEQSWFLLSSEDRAVLTGIESKGEEAAALARDLVHLAERGRPYIYLQSNVHQSDPQSGGVRKDLSSPISVFPNPAGSEVQIEYVLQDENSSLIVYDVYGKVIKHQTITAGNTKVILDVSSWASGVYLINISNEQGLFSSHPLVVE